MQCSGPSPPLLPHERLDIPVKRSGSEQDAALSYPSPPLSSSSKDRASKAGSNGSASSFDLCLDARGSTAQNVPTNSQEIGSRESPGNGSVAATPISGASAVSSMLAMFTKPLSIVHSKSSTSILSRLSNSRRASSSLAENENVKLTDGGSLPPQNQSTPPHTPRTRSHEGKVISTKNTPSKLSAKPISTEGATLGPVLGKLTVDITEGRGLKPSHDPYVVCEFQLSQFISEGPVAGRNENETSSQNGAGRITIRPASTEYGRPMAIPMRSRQSSNTGREPRTHDEVVNPKWDHRAVL